MAREFTFEELSRLQTISAAMQGVIEILAQLGDYTAKDTLHNTHGTNLAELIRVLKEEQDKILNKEAA